MSPLTDLFRSLMSSVRRSRQSSPVRRRRRRQSIVAAEVLEDRTLLSAITVDSNLDTVANDGVTTLREAIIEANGNGVADTICFDASLEGGTIALTSGSQLPIISEDLTIIGPGATLLTIDAREDTNVLATSRIFEIGTASTVEISGLMLTGGSPAGSGGAIFNSGILTVTNTILSENTASPNGGAIYNQTNTNSVLTVSNTTFSGNSAGTAGGAIYVAGGSAEITESTFSNNSATVNGGGIANVGTATVTASTFNNNSAARGGGIVNSGIMTLTNSTLSGNTANGIAGTTDGGGGILNTVTLNVTNSTIVLNQALVTSGGGVFNLAGATTLNNTIVAGNTVGTGTDGDIDGFSGFSFESGSRNNLIGDANSSGGLIHDPDGTGDGNIVGVGGIGVIDISTVLRPLQDNGGPTLTHALVTGSPAIDAGGNAHVPADVTTDQRGDGFARIVGAAVDIGAFEVQENQPPVVSDFTRTVVENNELAFSAVDFTMNFTDGDGDALVEVRIETLPANGMLMLNGMAVSAGDVITAADLDDLTFLPDLNFNGETTFTYTASDGTDFALTPATVTLDVLSSVAEQVAQIEAQVEALLAAGMINQGQADALKLNLRDNPGDAGKVQSFLHKLDAFVRGGILTEDQAADLITAGEDLLVSVTTQ